MRKFSFIKESSGGGGGGGALDLIELVPNEQPQFIVRSPRLIIFFSPSVSGSAVSYQPDLHTILTQEANRIICGSKGRSKPGHPARIVTGEELKKRSPPSSYQPGTPLIPLYYWLSLLPERMRLVCG